MIDISNSDDIIDSRDVEERIAELERARDARDDPDSDWPGSDESEELAMLCAFRDEAEPYCPDWRYGAMLIRESYFTDYAKELAEDIGAISRDAQWPLAHIDWEAAAQALLIDYSEASFDGVTYYFR